MKRGKVNVFSVTVYICVCVSKCAFNYISNFVSTKTPEMSLWNLEAVTIDKGCHLAFPIQQARSPTLI